MVSAPTISARPDTRIFARWRFLSAIRRPARSSAGSTGGPNSGSSTSLVISARGFAPRPDRQPRIGDGRRRGQTTRLQPDRADDAQRRGARVLPEAGLRHRRDDRLRPARSHALLHDEAAGAAARLIEFPFQQKRGEIRDGHAEHRCTAGTRPASPGRSFSLKLRGGETAGSIMMFEETVPAGTKSTFHLHRDSDELAYVLGGEITFMIGGEVTVGGPGACAFMPRGVPHAWKSTGAETGRVLFLYTPAK